jgi:hypothetical protein
LIPLLPLLLSLTTHCCSDSHGAVLVPLLLRAFESSNTRAQEDALKSLQVRERRHDAADQLGYSWEWSHGRALNPKP